MSEEPAPYGTPPQGKSSTNIRVFAGMVTDPVTLSAEIQSWIEEREADGFHVTDRWGHAVEGYMIITVWMEKKPG